MSNATWPDYCPRMINPSARFPFLMLPAGALRPSGADLARGGGGASGEDDEAQLGPHWLQCKGVSKGMAPIVSHLLD